MEYKTNKILLGYDYTPQLTASLKGLAGIYAGIANRDEQYKDDTTYSAKNTGRLLGLKLGVIGEINENNGIELGVKLENARMQSKTLLENEDASLKNENQTQKNIALFIGYTYKL